MGQEKKKWYQKGEFEDGYQFGDVFRTISNAIVGNNKKNEQKNTVLQNKKETQIKKSNNSNLTFGAVKNGKLVFDASAQMYGFANEDERQKYIKENPELYASMGGYKYVPSGTPLRNTESITKSNDAIQRIVERFKNTDSKKVQEAIKIAGSGEWQDANTMKKYTDTVNMYVNDYVALEKVGYFDYLPEDERKGYADVLNGAKELVNNNKKLFADYADSNDYNKAIWNDKYGLMTWDELEAQERKIKDNLLKKNNDGTGSLNELQYIKSLRNGFENPEAYNNYVEAVNMPFDELTKEFLETHGDLQKLNQIERSREITYAQQYSEWGFELKKQGYSEEEIYQKLTDDSDGYFKMLKDAEDNLQIDEKYGGIDALRSQYALLEELYYHSYSNEKTADLILTAMEDENYSYYVDEGKKKLKRNKYMTDTEYDVACYYEAKGGRNSKKYLEEVEDELQRREMKNREQIFASFADKMPVTASAASVPLNIIAAGEQVVDAVKFMTTGDVDYNTNALGASTIRGTVANKIDDPIGSFTYNTFMSGMDSIAVMGLSKAITGSGDMGSVILGLSAAGSATNDAINRGMSDGYAFANGVAAGVFEMLFESWSFGKFSEGLDNLSLKDMQNLSGFFAKNLCNNVLEEEYTEIANISYDIIFNGKYSQYETAIKNYMISGFSETEAKRKVALELADRVAEAAASGALMSFGFSSGGVVGTAVVDKINKNIDMLTQKLQSETTNAVTKPINSYPVEKQGMIKSFLNSVDNGLNDFVERVKNGSKKFERYKISEVSAREADDIKNFLGIDVKGYTHNINSDGIRHILKRHGVDGQQNSTMSKDNDIARIGWVIKNYDSVELLTKDGESGTSAGFKDKFGKPAPQIRYSKKINGTYYVVEAVFENDYNKLWVQSAYLKKDKEGVTQVPAESKNTNHVAYARSEFASPPSINSLSQGGEKVNKDYIAKEASSQEENASFFDDYNSEKRVPPINPDEVIEGIWEDSPKRDKNIVEKSRLESVENVMESDIIKAIPLSRYVNSSDDIYANSSKIKPISNFEDMVIHGDAFGFQINDKDGNPIDNYNALEFANILKEDPNYNGGNIRLISCESGSVEFGAAQILANELGVEVLAPTDIVWITIDGEMIVGPTEFENTGEWKIFKPKRRK